MKYTQIDNKHKDQHQISRNLHTQIGTKHTDLCLQ